MEKAIDAFVVLSILTAIFAWLVILPTVGLLFSFGVIR